MTLDYAVVLADLEHRIAQMQAAVAAIRPLVGEARPAPAVRLLPDAAPVAARVRPAATGGEDAMRQAEALYMKGEKPAAIAKAVGRSVATVYGWTSTHKWADKRKAASKPGSAPTSPLLRRCTGCSQKTSADAARCSHCGHKEAA